MRLFAERAAQVVSGFAATEANMAAVAGICGRLEGLPLAIELAAAQTRVLSPEQVEARLGDRLGLLTRGSRARPARHQTLRASIEWSYELTSQAERLLWARLSVFAGGFELNAAESICADHRLPAGQMLDLLAFLLLGPGPCQRGPISAQPCPGPGPRAHGVAGAGLLLAGFLAAVSGDRHAASPSQAPPRPRPARWPGPHPDPRRR